MLTLAIISYQSCLGGNTTFCNEVVFVYHNNSLLQLPFMMHILIIYYMHTNQLSEMMDDASISLTCDLWAYNLSSKLQYIYHKK